MVRDKDLKGGEIFCEFDDFRRGGNFGVGGDLGEMEAFCFSPLKSGC